MHSRPAKHSTLHIRGVLKMDALVPSRFWLFGCCIKCLDSIGLIIAIKNNNKPQKVIKIKFAVFISAKEFDIFLFVHETL